MSVTIEQIESLLEAKLKPINDKIDSLSSDLNTMQQDISIIRKDLSEIRRDLGYHNLTILKGKKDEREEM